MIHSLYRGSIVPSLCMPLSEKQSGEQSQISLAYFQKVVRTNEIVNYYIALPIKHLYSGIRTYFEWVCHNIAWLHCR